MPDTVHIVRAGMAGLAAAVALVREGRAAMVHEASGQAGGRCRSFVDAKLVCSIDNGNHLLLSGNASAMRYLRDTGSEGRLVGPARACFPFLDLRTGQRWRLQPSRGVVPWWILDPRRRVPDTRARDYFSAVRLAGREGSPAAGWRHGGGVVQWRQHCAGSTPGSGSGVAAGAGGPKGEQYHRQCAFSPVQAGGPARGPAVCWIDRRDGAMALCTWRCRIGNGECRGSACRRACRRHCPGDLERCRGNAWFRWVRPACVSRCQGKARHLRADT